ncbi:MAG: (E)-4-hydroxy-3-methylbut-2-enyl-diphosphate synthase [Bacteroidales bacterium]|nr:(E)-4-hydroxy-3-methylbut-2-enyl-diphosphate synthase [Bacteroidales bacterium]
MEYTESLTNYNRFLTKEVNIGGVKIGNQNPIAVQTMCNTSTDDVEKTVNQIVNVARKTSCDIIRVTVPTLKDVEPLKQIHLRVRALGIKIPIVADVHFNAEIAFKCAQVVEKVRVNPGNFGHHNAECLSQKEYDEEGDFLKKTFSDFLKVCKQYGTAVRIGTNHGSLSKRILNRYGDTPEGMVESVLEFLRVAEKENFSDIVISLKSSNPTVAIRSARLLVKAMKNENMNFPLHLGVTEAGEGQDGRQKSAAGISPLLQDGIGGTIRVSLTEDPENEILPAHEIIAFNDWVKEAEKLPEIPFFYNPYVYQKRKTFSINGFGGDNVPKVAIVIKEEKDLLRLQENQELLQKENNFPDLLIVDNKDILFKAKSLLRGIKIVGKNSDDEVFSVLTISEKTDYENLKKNTLSNRLLIAEPLSRNKVGALRYIFYKLNQNGIENPVLLKPDGGQVYEKSFAFTAQSCGVFIDGFGDGICLESGSDLIETIRLGFKILQISRLRISGNEYVSCPGCGRTLYNLQDTVKKIKEATKKYKNLKIAVMGCIVNGPGEMADADYGYVGAGRNKISLYKAGKPVKTGIDEDFAVEELLKLIDNSY